MNLRTGLSTNRFTAFFAIATLSLLSTFLSPAWAKDSAQFQFKDHGKLMHALTLAEIKAKIPAKEITIFDINEQTDITYVAIPFNKIAELELGKDWSTAEEILFTCTDGYQPSLPKKLFAQYEAYLAFERKGDESFSLINKLENNKKVSVGPFYLIWNTANKAVLNESPSNWPYQIASMDLVSFESRFPKLSPPAGASKSAMNGFQAFRNKCLSCHAINGEGGHAGPELNYPTNVSEMLQPGMLKKWLKEPSNMRWKTMMPGVPEGTPNRDQMITDLIAYLNAMKSKKIEPAKN